MEFHKIWIEQCAAAEEIQNYLDHVKRLGAAGHVCSDEEFEEL